MLLKVVSNGLIMVILVTTLLIGSVVNTGFTEAQNQGREENAEVNNENPFNLFFKAISHFLAGEVSSIIEEHGELIEESSEISSDTGDELIEESGEINSDTDEEVVELKKRQIEGLQSHLQVLKLETELRSLVLEAKQRKKEEEKREKEKEAREERQKQKEKQEMKEKESREKKRKRAEREREFVEKRERKRAEKERKSVDDRERKREKEKEEEEQELIDAIYDALDDIRKREFISERIFVKLDILTEVQILNAREQYKIDKELIDAPTAEFAKAYSHAYRTGDRSSLNRLNKIREKEKSKLKSYFDAKRIEILKEALRKLE